MEGGVHLQHKKQELMDGILEYADRYIQKNRKSPTCLLYTSDAADE